MKLERVTESRTLECSRNLYNCSNNLEIKNIISEFLGKDTTEITPKVFGYIMSIFKSNRGLSKMSDKFKIIEDILFSYSKSKESSKKVEIPEVKVLEDKKNYNTIDNNKFIIFVEDLNKFKESYKLLDSSQQCNFDKENFNILEISGENINNNKIKNIFISRDIFNGIKNSPNYKNEPVKYLIKYLNFDSLSYNEFFTVYIYDKIYECCSFLNFIIRLEYYKFYTNTRYMKYNSEESLIYDSSDTKTNDDEKLYIKQFDIKK